MPSEGVGGREGERREEGERGGREGERERREGERGRREGEEGGGRERGGRERREGEIGGRERGEIMYMHTSIIQMCMCTERVCTQ